eukprot:TRINITY_DN5067_c0_g1_i3.p1 TRINITY_DN5067_c0_g1~~TRINITY_DN5067_c0_g1_i3.p1  ORF type:complete len:178 (-),score=32.74 TRINITY_DN5067_c0_g1_i3:206-739(-)
MGSGKGEYEEAIKQVTYSIYLDSILYGPENYRLTSRYFLMAMIFRQQSKDVESRSFIAKIISIWKNFLLKYLCRSTKDNLEKLLMVEAYDNLQTSISILESDLGGMNPLVGECLKTLGLIEIVQDNNLVAAEYLEKAYDVLNNSAGQFDTRTKEIAEIQKLNVQKKEIVKSKPKPFK